MKKRLLAAVFVCVWTMIFFASAGLAKEGIDAEKYQTIMIYMVGTDLESEGGMASVDIQEMMDANIDFSTTNVLIYTGGCRMWQLDISSEYNCVFELTPDGIAQVGSTKYAESMGIAETLRSFLEFAREGYPAKQYGLILWDHGAGPLIGVGMDELNNDDALSLFELRDALEQSGFNGESAKLEFVGFDACLMGSIEVAHTLKEYANYMIASEETEPGFGWYYRFLNEISHTTGDGRYIGETIVRTYGDYAGTQSDFGSFSMDATLSCVDLSKTDEVENALDHLFSDVSVDFTETNFVRLAKERQNTKGFGRSPLAGSSEYYDLVDLKDMAQNMQEDYPQETSDLLEALDAFVQSSYSNIENANGIAIYYPYENKTIADQGYHIYQMFDFCPAYTQYMGEFLAVMMGESLTKWDIERKMPSYQLQQNEVGLSFALTPEQAENFSSAEYTIFAKEEEYAKEYVSNYYLFSYDESSYVPLYQGGDVTLDEAGTLNASYDGRWFSITAKADGDSSAVCPAYLGEKDGKEYFDVTVMLYEFPDRDSEDLVVLSDCQIGCIRFCVDRESKQIDIMGVVPILSQNEEDENDDQLNFAVAPKGILSLEEVSQRYEYMQVVNNSYFSKTDEAGKLLPFSEWENGSTLYVSTELSLKDGFSVTMDKLDRLESLVCVYQITDLQHNVYSSDIVEVPVSFTKTQEEMQAQELDYFEMAEKLFGIGEKEQEEYKLSFAADGNYQVFSNEKDCVVEIEPFEQMALTYASVGYLSVHDLAQNVQMTFRLERLTQDSLEEVLEWEMKYLKYDDTEYYQEGHASGIEHITVNGREYPYWIETGISKDGRTVYGDVQAVLQVGTQHDLMIELEIDRNAKSDEYGEAYYKELLENVLGHVAAIREGVVSE